jgi:hypothetical protein
MIQVHYLLTRTPPNSIQILIQSLKLLNTWLKNNYLSLNFEKKYFIHFKAKNNPPIDMKSGYNNKLIPSALSTKFLGLTIDSVLPWRIHIHHLKTKSKTACQLIRSIKPLMSYTLLLIYYSLLHTVRSHRIIFWGNSCHSIQIFQMQKSVIRNITGCGNKDSCIILFKKLQI